MDYASEPVVACAAFLALYGPGSKFSFGQLLDRLKKEIRNGAIEAGFRGELVGKLLLMMARDEVVKKAYPNSLSTAACRTCSVEEFLESLGGDTLVTEVKRSDRMQHFHEIMNARVSFNHFFYVDYTVAQGKDLLPFFARGCAIQCKRGQSGADFLIPLLMNDGKMSVIIVSLKNYSKRSTEMKLASSKSSAEKVGIALDDDVPYLVLFMDVGNDLEPLVQNMTPQLSYDLRSTRSRSAISTSQITVGLNSLKVYPLLNDELREKLGEVSKAWCEPMQLLKRDEEGYEAKKTILKSYLQPRYLEPSGEGSSGTKRSASKGVPQQRQKKIKK